MATENVTGFQVGANINPFEQAMRRMVDAAKDGQSGVAGALAQINNVKGLFIGFAAAIGGIKLAGFVNETMDAIGNLKDMSQKTGMTVESLSGLHSVAKLSGTSLDSIAGASNKLSFALSGANEDSKGAAAAIKALGLNYSDFANMSPEDRMLAVAKAMNGFKDGAGKTAVAMALFGKAGAEMLPFLADLGEQGEIVAKVTKEQSEAADRYGDNIKKLQSGSEAWKKTLVAGMAPALAQVSNALLGVFNQSGGLKDQIAQLSADGSITRWTRTAVIGLSYAADGVSYLASAFKSLIATLGTAALQITSIVGGLATGLSKAIGGDFSGAADAMQTGFGKALRYGKELQAELKDMWAGDTIGQRFRAAMKNPQAENAEPQKDLDFKNKGIKDGKKEPSQMPIYEAELARKIELFEKEAQAQGTLRQFSKTEEAAYWKEVSQRAEVSAEDKARAEKKWRDIERTLRTDAFAVEMAGLEQQKQEAPHNSNERIRLAQEAHTRTVAMYGAESKEAATAWGKVLEERRKLHEQMRQLDEIANRRQRDQALANVEADRQDAQHQLDMGLITQAQLLEQQAQFEQRMHAIKLQALQASLDTVDPQKDPVKKAEIDAQIEQLELQHQLRMKQLANQTVQAQSAELRAMASEVQGSWAGTFKGILTGTLSLGQGIRNLFKGIVDAVAGMLAQMAAKWIVQQVFMKGIEKAMAMAKVGEESAKAGAAGVASMAGAPFPLNLSAPAFGASMAAAAMSFAPIAASASGGFDIPKGLNPVTQLHAEEMVLPAHIANPLRQSLDAGGGVGGGQPAPVVNLHVSALDGASVKRVLMDNQGALVAALSKAYRNGHRP